ncbi:methyl-accepting chemotaxis protein [Bacillus sp. A116_S68]|nr:methyl-accepting chemotaxis protein [Bacillus sp. A116_S68]
MLKKITSKTIAKSIISFIIPVILVVLLVISFIGYFFSKTIIETQLDNQMDTKIQETVQSIDNVLTTQKAVVKSMAKTVEANLDQFNEADYKALLEGYLPMYDETFGMGIWFEPYTVEEIEQFAPFAFKEGDSIILDDTYTTGDLNIWTTEWYEVGKQPDGGWTESYFDPSTDVAMVTAAYPFYESNGQLAGVVTVDIDISSIQTMIANLEIDYDGVAMLLEDNGVYLGGVDEELLTVANIQENSNTSLVTAAENMLGSDTGKSEYNEGNETSLFYYSTIPKTDWKVGISVKESMLYASLNRLMYMFVITSVVSLIVVTVLIVIFSTRMGKTAKRYSDVAEAVADGDLINTFEEKELQRKDELGDIGRSLFTMQDNLIDVVKNFQSDAANIDDNAQTLSSFSQQMSATSENVAAAITDVAESTTDQYEALKNVDTMIQQFGTDLDFMNQSITEVDGTSTSIMTVASESSEVMSNMTSSFEALTGTFSTLIERVKSVEVNISQVNEMTDLINAIADQTNLLALNAAIEAARAGEAGKGFAVVADEIRKLAEQSRESSETINEIIKGVASEAGAMVGSTDEVNNELLSQRGHLDDTMGAFNNIIEAVESMRPKVETTKGTSEKIKADKELVLKEVEKAGEIAENVAASAQEISASAEEMASSTEEVAASATSLGNMTNGMKERIKFFNIDKGKM